MAGVEAEGRGQSATGLDETRVTSLGNSPSARAPADPDLTRAPSRAAFAGSPADLAVETTLRAPTTSRGDETVVLRDLTFTGADGSSEMAEAAFSQGRIGRFVILRELGRGAMGVVLAAYDEELDRKVAIKLMHASRGYDASLGRGILLREAQAMARLAHPNVVAVHEVGVVEGGVFVAMEYVAGLDLQRWLADKRRTWREVVAALRQAGAGLVAAHREGLIHRDFKPSNVLVGEDGRLRVADFGLAARRGAATRREGSAPAPVHLTATLAPAGALVGTPAYMAPELLRGGSATALSDQYAFCVALYEALYETRPFTGETLEALIAEVERGALPQAPPRPEVPAWLHAAVCRGLAKAPERRFASLEELVDLLARDPEAEHQQRRRRALQIVAVVAGTAALVALLVLAYGALRRLADERLAEARLSALRGQIEGLLARDEAPEAGRLLRSFVTLPENRGLPVVARAYLEWAAVQRDPTAAVDAYASAYITARTDRDGRDALRGLIHHLSAQDQIAEAAAALAVLAQSAPDEAATPELQEIRLAAALWQRDLAAARTVLAEHDPEAWSTIFDDLLHVVEVPAGPEGPLRARASIATLDFDGRGGTELVVWSPGQPLQVFAADSGLRRLAEVDLGAPTSVVALAPVVPGESLVIASYPRSSEHELRLLRITAEGTAQTLSAWDDSFNLHPRTVDLDGDGQREVYLGTEHYTRHLWRLDRAADGTWSRRFAHAPTEAAHSDVTNVLSGDFDGDGAPELAVTLGAWRAYDLRLFRPRASGDLDQVARRAFGAFLGAAVVRGPGRDLITFVKTSYQVAPDRFPPDKPLGEPDGLYVVGRGAAGIETLGFVPTSLGTGVPTYCEDVLTGDLDGDGQDEIVLDVRTRGTMLLRWRPGEPLRPRTIAGLYPLAVHDFDGDGRAELLGALHEEPQRLVLLGAGSATLPPLPPPDLEPRPIPPRIADPVIAEAWAHAEQLVAIGLPRRTAAELSQVARLSEQVANDMLFRAAELFESVGDDTAAAEHFAAAATRPDLAARALASAVGARRRLGEFAAAEALARQRLGLVGADERREAQAELDALAVATAPRPELELSFHRPLDPRWRVRDPVALRRALARGALSVWASHTPVLAELPLQWDGGPAALEIGFDVDQLQWGTKLGVRLVRPDGTSWLSASVSARGPTTHPVVTVGGDEGDPDRPELQLAGASTGSVRIAVTPGLEIAVREIEIGADRERVVTRAIPTPPPGPLTLQVTSELLASNYVGHVWLRSIHLTGFALGSVAAEPDDPAHLLAEGEATSALAALGAPAPGSERHLWRIDALMSVGRVDEAAAEIQALLAALPDDAPTYRALEQRLRRGDELAWQAARASFGPRLIDLILDPAGNRILRPGDVDVVLRALPPTDPSDAPSDPEAQQRLILIDDARGQALRIAGRLEAARDAYAAALARVATSAAPLRDELYADLLREQIAVAAALADREAALMWIRRDLERSEMPYLALEKMQADPELARLIGEGTWRALTDELR